MSIEYEFVLHTPAGVPIRALSLSSLDSVITEREIGTTTIELDPFKYDFFQFHRDQILTISRSVDGLRPYLVGERIWFLRGRSYEQREEADVLVLTFKDTIDLLDRRLIAYYAEEPEADKFDYADNMLKEMVRENLTDFTLDPDRDIESWLSVATATAQCPEVEKLMAWQRLLQSMQEIAQDSENKGTYLGFDIVCIRPPHQILGVTNPRFDLQFRTYAGQRGQDRRVSAGKNNVLIGPDFKNLKDLKFTDDWTGEFTHVYAGGEGEGILRDIEEADYPALGFLSPFSRREGWHDVRDLDLVPDIEEEAESFLQQHLTRSKISGIFVDTRKVRWDIDIGFGDLVSVQFRKKKADARLSKVHTTWKPGPEGEKVELFLEGLATEVSI